MQLYILNFTKEFFEVKGKKYYCKIVEEFAKMWELGSQCNYKDSEEEKENGESLSYDKCSSK